jgi:hypothetical protein
MSGGAGELEQWDLHVGAELDVLGRKVVLRKVRQLASSKLLIVRFGLKMAD